MPLIDLSALDNCELQTDPFDHIVVPDFLPPEALQRINVDYPAIDTATNHELHDLKYGPLFTNFLFELQTDAFRTPNSETKSKEPRQHPLRGKRNTAETRSSIERRQTP